ASRLLDQSSCLLAADDTDDDFGLTALDCSACTANTGDDTADCDRTAESHENENVQITPTLNNSMPPTRTPTVRIVNSTPLNHDHLAQHHYHHHLQQYHPYSHSGHSGSRHTSRVFCSPFRILWFEDDADDLAILKDSHRNPHKISTASFSPGDVNPLPPPSTTLNDSDSDFQPLGTPGSHHDQSATSRRSRDEEELPGNGSRDDTAASSLCGGGSQQSITSTPNSSLFKTMRTSAMAMNGLPAAAAASSSVCDNSLSAAGGYSSFLTKKKLKFKTDDDDSD
uniref:Uncharacterized protein n=1 Tax=Anopheles maculatus TaxID=74869 RepID=A0A182SFT4_9DIPT